MNPFDELRAFNAVKLAEKMSMKDEEFIRWLTDLKLVPRGRICDCGFEMRIYLSPEFDKQQWKCRRNACRRSKGLYTNTFFHNWRLPIKYLFKLSYYWCFGKLNVQRLRDELRKNGGRVPTHQTILSFNAFLRGVCSSYFRLNPLQLGGEGVRVNIERIIIAREPATIAGAVSKEHWGFCGEELGSNVCFIEEIDEETSSSLNSNSLLMVIDRYIRPGTMIVSTLWKKYEVNGELPEAFKHLARQRSIRFIEAENEQCENDIPMLWDKFKRIQYKGLDRTPLICAYIKEFMWRQLFGGDDCMYHLWSHIASMYPL
uniref:DDE_Tnp_IS1595 domain-containing protein n=1 Tax=Ascaris lumbricoides TaxID=6252 RepID=A0A0M3HHH2_ASCLU